MVVQKTPQTLVSLLEAYKCVSNSNSPYLSPLGEICHGPRGLLHRLHIQHIPLMHSELVKRNTQFHNK